MPLYDVILMGFPGAPRVGGTPAAAIAGVFGIPLDVAARLVERAPSIVKQGVDELDARRYHNAFHYIGAECRFREVAPLPEESLRLDVDSKSLVRTVEHTGDPPVTGFQRPEFPEAPAASDEAWAHENTRPPSDDHPVVGARVDFEAATDGFDDWDPWSDSGLGGFASGNSPRVGSGAPVIDTGTLIDAPADRRALLEALEQAGAAKPGVARPPVTLDSSPVVPREQAAETGVPDPDRPRPTFEAKIEELYGLSPAEFIEAVANLDSTPELELDYSGDRPAAPADADPAFVETPTARTVPHVVQRTVQGMRVGDWGRDALAEGPSTATSPAVAPRPDLSVVVHVTDDGDSE